MPFIHAAKARFQQSLPEPGEALASGLLALGGDLAPHTLIGAYARGIFPWYSEGEPLMWWAPAPRAALLLPDFRISRRSARAIRNSGFRVSFDQDFLAVIGGCAERTLKRSSTWITADMREAYLRLHILGYAHSVEIWLDDNLVGGLYGVALGQVFYGESMFRRVSEASRAALSCLVAFLASSGYMMLDCQQASAHMMSMGAKELAGEVFQAMLGRWVRNLAPIVWNVRQNLPVRDFLTKYYSLPARS